MDDIFFFIKFLKIIFFFPSSVSQKGGHSCKAPQGEVSKAGPALISTNDREFSSFTVAFILAFTLLPEPGVLGINVGDV